MQNKKNHAKNVAYTCFFFIFFISKKKKYNSLMFANALENVETQKHSVWKRKYQI